MEEHLLEKSLSIRNLINFRLDQKDRLQREVEEMLPYTLAKFLKKLYNI
jgi:hypothetical protein